MFQRFKISLNKCGFNTKGKIPNKVKSLFSQCTQFLKTQKQKKINMNVNEDCEDRECLKSIF